MHVPAPRSDMRSKGEIQVIFGPMFSGKTTELIRRMKRYQVATHKCLIIKYANDTRYEAASSLSTHDRQTLAATSATTLTPLIDAALNFSVIGIDEGQFFPDTVEFCELMANSGKTVIVAALDGTYQRQGFGNILSLVPLAESIVKLTAVCMRCYGDASYTKRKGLQTELEVIGGSDIYMAVCRTCYNAPASPQKSAKKRTPFKEASASFDTEANPAKRKLMQECETEKTKSAKKRTPFKETSTTSDIDVTLAKRKLLQEIESVA